MMKLKTLSSCQLKNTFHYTNTHLIVYVALGAMCQCCSCKSIHLSAVRILPIIQSVKFYSQLSSSTRKIITSNLCLVCNFTVFPANENAATAQCVFPKFTHISLPLEMLAGHSVGKADVYTAGKMLMSSVWDSWQEDGGSRHVLTAKAFISFHLGFNFEAVSKQTAWIITHFFTQQHAFIYLLNWKVLTKIRAGTSSSVSAPYHGRYSAHILEDTPGETNITDCAA